MTFIKFILCAATLLVAQSAGAQPTSPPPRDAVAPVAAAASGSDPQAKATNAPLADPNYRLGIADKVRVIVFNEETLSGEFTVSDAGTLSLPLIGDVPVSGRTQREVVEDIESKLADGYLRQPRVSMDVLTYRPFYILGEVGKPGEYAYSNGLTAINAIARAEGFTYRANKRRVWIRRAGETKEEDYKLGTDVRIYPGDTVRVGQRFF